jgi:hypothetical protein
MKLPITFAIPTFDRYEKLCQRILELNQLRNDFEIIILDNASNYNTEKFENFKVEITKPVKFIRNTFNYGAPVNIIKCFELCTTKYLWIISDDDPLNIYNIQNCLDIILENLDVDYFNFGFHDLEKNDESYYGFGIDEIIEKSISYSNLIFPANSVYNVNIIKKNIHKLYHYTSSMCPQFMAAILILDKNGRFCLHDIEVAKVVINNDPDFVQWSYLMGYAGFDFILSSPHLGPKSSLRLRNLIYESLPNWRILIGSIVILINEDVNTSYISLLRYISYKSPFSIRIACYISIIIINSPKWFKKMLYKLIAFKYSRIPKVGNPH